VILTDFYHDNDLVRQETACTLVEFVKNGRLKPGQFVKVADITVDDNGEEHFENVEKFWVGDCTPYHRVSVNDGGFGWLWTAEGMDRLVFEVFTFEVM
jgi:hypothetical protein